MSTRTHAAQATNTETLATVDEFTHTLPAGPERDAINVIIETFRAGSDVIVAGTESTVTPSQAAQVLGVSRAHLYKVLDSGALPFTVVGARDRRIAMADLHDYVTRTEELRRSAAQQAAQSRRVSAMAIDEM